MKKLNIKFHLTENPIQELTTKFGGQPNWLTKPEWPLSRSLNKQMSFIGQIKIDKNLLSFNISFQIVAKDFSSQSESTNRIFS